MCGIAGILNFDGRPADSERSAALCAMLGHRGPDAAACLVDGPVGLAHARLSVVDIAGGAQPMATADGSLAITYNGEIFNHAELRAELAALGRRFRTRSDTEVILHAYAEWGDACVHHFNGQWAFAIWDSRQRSLFLSRDRIGIRPLFYTVSSGSFIFASEMKALFAAGVEPALDPIGLAQVFRFWVTLPPRTAFAGIQQLAPGCSMSVRDGRVTTRQYWDMDFGGVDESRSAGDYAHELLDLLLDATRLRLRADVPVAAYLSGGLDSSAVTWMAKTVSHAAIDTFSVAFDDAEYDERVFQEDAAHGLGTRHHVVRCGVRQIADTFSDVVWHAETPVLRTAPAPMLALSGAVRDAGYKVVLSGEGADEMLGGYDIFKEAKVRAYCASQPASRRRPQLFRRLYPYLPGVQRQPAQLLERFLHTSAGDIEHPFFSHLPRWNMTSRLQLLFSDDTLKHIRGYDPYEDVRQCLPEAFGGWDPLARAQYLEAKLLLPGYILSSQGDRMAMGHSVETRMPFLDYRVVELATRMPARFKMKALTEKYLLKQCMRGRLPASIVARPKQPYRAPGGCGFFSAVQHVSAALSGGAVSESGVFNPRAVAALTAKFQGDRAIGARDDMALAGVLSTQLLMQQFVRDFPKQAKRHRNAHRATAA